MINDQYFLRVIKKSITFAAFLFVSWRVTEIFTEDHVGGT